MFTSVLAACGPGLSPGDGDGGGSSSGAATQATTEGVGFVDEELWRLSLDRTIWTQPPVGDEPGNVYVMATRADPADPSGADLHSLIKVSEQGELDWELDLGSSPGASGLAVGPDGDVWVCFLGAVSRVSADGSLLWTEADACSGTHSIAVGKEVSVSVHVRREVGSDSGLWEVIAIDSDGIRLWARDVGVVPPYSKNQVYESTSIVGAALSGTSVYVGCDTCAARPAIVELDLANGSTRNLDELDGVEWREPYRTVFGAPRITSDGVWIEAYQDGTLRSRRTWLWAVGSAVNPIEAFVPIEAETGLAQRDYREDEVQLIVDGEARVVDFGSIQAEVRASLWNAEPAARGSDDSVLMVSVPDPPQGQPRYYTCGEEGVCRVYVVDASARVTWVLGEDSSLPYVGDGRVVYVAPNGDLVAHTAPLTPLTYGWSQWLANGQGNACRDCGG